MDRFAARSRTIARFIRGHTAVSPRATRRSGRQYGTPVRTVVVPSRSDHRILFEQTDPTVPHLNSGIAVFVLEVL